MKNLGIGTKMTLLVAVLLATAIAIAVVGIRQMGRMNATFARIVDVESRAIAVSEDLRIELLSAVRAEKNAILAATPGEAEAFAASGRKASQRVAELREELGRLLARAAASALSDGEASGGAASLGEFDRDFDELRRNQEEVLKLAVVKSEAQADAILFADLRQREQEFIEFLRTIQPPAAPAGAAASGAPAGAIATGREAQGNLHRFLFNLAAHLRSQDEKTMNQLETELRQDFSALQDSLRRLGSQLSEGDRARGLAAIAALEGAKPLLTKAIEHSAQNSNERARHVSATRSVELGSRCDGELVALTRELAANLEAAKHSAEDSMLVGRTIVIATACVGGLLSLLIAGAVIRSITVPVAKGVTVLESIAEGDLTRRMALDRADEIGRLAAATDDMSARLQKGVARTRTLANALDSAAQGLSSVSHDLLSQSQEMATQAESVAAATEQMSTNVSSMAAAAEQMSVNIASISSASEELSVNVGTISSSAATTSRNVGAVAEAIEKITSALKSVAADAQSGSRMGEEARGMAAIATKAMHQLNAAADDINKVTDVIKAISLQTNLLAINATIEATSAGEAGRGFAVVAGEIKELANQSGHSAGDIASKIESVQASTAEAVRVIENVADFIGQLSVAVARISDSVQAQTQTANRVSSDVAGARDGVEGIARSIAEVAKGATDVSSNTAELSRAAIDVSRNAAEAASAARSISPNIHGVSEATRQSSRSAGSVNESARRLREISSDLLRNVSHFRTGPETGAGAGAGADEAPANG